VECLIAQLSKVLVHYGCTSGVGIQMQVSLELLLTELGASEQPLQAPFCTYGRWVTHSWLKSIWEKVDKFNITVEIAALPITPPRKGDRWFMKHVMESGVVTSQEELIALLDMIISTHLGIRIPT
jgi:hypothetical protein